jgi:hypothetical protein
VLPAYRLMALIVIPQVPILHKRMGLAVAHNTIEPMEAETGHSKMKALILQNRHNKRARDSIRVA